MRLLDVDTLEFRYFHEAELPPYAILSHCWGKEEVSYQDMCWLQKISKVPNEFKFNPLYHIMLAIGTGTQSSVDEEDITKRAGYIKIVKTAELAKSFDYQYFWIDTCCIDKGSSAELQEAINSMFRWYELSGVCIAFLEDVLHTAPADEDQQNLLWSEIPAPEIEKQLKECRWVTRGWTLQELIAPSYVCFYDRDWKYMWEKRDPDALEYLSTATHLPRALLLTGKLSTYCVAERMSWASRRSTTRVEDESYCLMGLFGINMPMLYGEGGKAFIRLQEEIMKTFADDSIFAWKVGSSESTTSTYRGLLARSPSEFKDSAGIRGGLPSFMSNTNLGLNIEVDISAHIDKIGLYYMVWLNAWQYSDIGESPKGPVRLALRRLESTSKQYARIQLDSFSPYTYSRDMKRSRDSIYVRQTPLVPPNLITGDVRSIHLEISHSRIGPDVWVENAFPPDHWDKDQNIITIPAESRRFTVQLHLGHSVGEGQDVCTCLPTVLVLDCDYVSDHIWCELRKGEEETEETFWVKRINHNISRIPSSSPNVLDTAHMWLSDCHSHMNCRVEARFAAGLRNDQICYVVEIKLSNL